MALGLITGLECAYVLSRYGGRGTRKQFADALGRSKAYVTVLCYQFTALTQSDAAALERFVGKENLAESLALARGEPYLRG